MASASLIALQLDGHRQGKNWRCSCPLYCGYDLSLRDGDDGLLAYCFGGCTYTDIVAALVQYGLLDDFPTDTDRSSDGSRYTPTETELADTARRIAGARAIYAEATPNDPIVERYWRARGSSQPVPGVIRFHPCCPHRLGKRLPAMVAPVVDPRGVQTGTHITYLRPGGDGKAKFSDPRLARETRGVVRGGVIRLAPLDSNRELIVAEGIESAFSASEIFRLPAWSSVYAGNLKCSLDLPMAARRIIVAADNDPTGTGLRAAQEAKQRWVAEGRSVQIRMPRSPYGDFNDILKAGNGRHA